MQISYLKKSGYGGVMAWTLDLDDFNNDCCSGVYPQLQEINVALGRLPPYPGKLDCSRPVVVPLDNVTNPSLTTNDMDGEGTYRIQPKFSIQLYFS